MRMSLGFSSAHFSWNEQTYPFSQMNEFTFGSPFIFAQIKLGGQGGESDKKIERKCKAEAQMGERNGKTERDVEQLQ